MTSGNWSEIDIDGYSATVFEPPQRYEHGYVLLYLPDTGEGFVEQQAMWEAELTRSQLPMIAPRGPWPWWFDRTHEEFTVAQSPAHYLKVNVLAKIQAQWGSESPKIAVMGHGMGGQGALGLSYAFPQLFPVVAALRPAIDFFKQYYNNELLQQIYQDPEDARQDSAILHIHPLNWPRHHYFACDPTAVEYEGADRLRMKLQSIGIQHERDLDTTPEPGTTYLQTMLPGVLDILTNALNRERLRVD